MDLQRHRIHLNGIVQGVGFRPFVYRLAHENTLAGFVCNTANGLLIEVEGRPHDLSNFGHRLHKEAPSLAIIISLEQTQIPCFGEIGFTIQTSLGDERPSTLIAPDLGICRDCLRELFDPHDRRYLYPFINCTQCGPRYTIVHDIPYDRPNTSMSVFPMCHECSQEYHNPANRRFHAQPNACPICGPRVIFTDRNGNEIEQADPVALAIEVLKQGNILAIRGMGGFHLAVDAQNENAVQELRRRKGRAEKPFALMAPDIQRMRAFCFVDTAEEELLNQPNRPIVLLRTRDNHNIAPTVAPGNRYLGFMLPYTPLHYLLLHNHFEALVMTSGNFSEEPIAISNREALERLAPLADFFLLHNREILQRCDDSIVRLVAGKPRVLRRSRGYVPAPVILAKPTSQKVLACGAELKNTIALSRHHTVFLSQHIGDLDNPAALAFFADSIDHLQKLLHVTPEAIAYDLHPEYLSTKWALKQKHVRLIGVQHHHAHLASVMAENGAEEPTIGIILDGTGYGLDGTLWGGEVLIGDYHSFERFAWLEPVPMPGSTAAIREPWRMALSYLYAAYRRDFRDRNLELLKRVPSEKIDLIVMMIEKRLNSPLTSGCGRLFDGVAALLNLRREINFEAQAAMDLEMAAEDSCCEDYPQALNSLAASGPLAVSPLIKAVVDDIENGEKIGKISSRFHRTCAEIFLAAALSARNHSNIKRVGLSGGAFQNVQLFKYLLSRLEEEEFEVLTHSQVPCNDGGIALGQIAIANARMEQASQDKPKRTFMMDTIKNSILLPNNLER
jgi:hydrogenase maturation protein HypF